MNVDIQGSVAPGFEPVIDTFASLWDDIEVGAGFCVYYQGEIIIDLWGGYTDREASGVWQADTLVNVYSTTKGPASLAMAILVDEGKIRYEDRVADYWPEFGAHGKGEITVAQLLSHQAGLSGVDTRLTVEDLYDWNKMTRLLAEQKPLWPPGTASGYHAITWGYFPGELIRRITGQTLSAFFQEKVASPLQADFFIGLPESEFSRCATLIGPNRARRQPEQVFKPRMPPLFFGALMNPSISPYRHACSREWRLAEIAASNGHASARGIARIYGALAMEGQLEGKRIISESALAEATRTEVEGTEDLVLGGMLRRARGFMLNSDNAYGPARNAFGHAGAGGSLGFADVESGIGFGYAMNQMQPDTALTPRSRRLAEAVYQCL